MTNYNYSLQKYKGRKTRFQCPECLEKFEFTKYIHNETGEYIDDSVGRCNNQDKCGYHKPPREYFKEKGIHVENYSITKVPPINKNPSFIDEEILINSLYSDNQKSNLFHFLYQYFDENKVRKVFHKYFVGVSNKWLKAIIFWQVDKQMKVRSGKIMRYNAFTGKRDKKNFFWIKNETETTEMQQVFF